MTDAPEVQTRPGSTPHDPAFERLLRHLSDTRGFDFTAYKRTTLMRRTRLRMQALHVESYADYLDYLEVDPDEFTRFFDTILINVTSFFRDAPAWEVLRERVVPAILEARSPHEQIRIWCAGCASGEEAFSLLMLFAEALGPERALQRLKIYATDVDARALEVARASVYPAKHLLDVPPELREKYFEPAGPGSFTFRRELRRLAIFGRHDLLRDAPISKVDLLSCRNTLMYFNAESQQRVLARLFFAVRDSGYLFLGKSETLLAHSLEMRAVDLKYRVFVKVALLDMRARLLAQAGEGRQVPRDGRPSIAPDQRIRESAFDVDPSAQIVVDSSSVLVLANGTARRLFGIRDRDVGRPLQDLEISYRPVELRSLIDRAVGEQRQVVVRETAWPLPDGTPRWIDTIALPLFDGAELIGVKFVIRDVTHFKQLQADVEASHSEIETAYEELESSNEELETTNEELHSTVEELETTNEELQSSNEELETMNEELQSSNEELETLNVILRERTDELDLSNAYLSTILSSLRMGVVVLNHNLEVLIWNAQAEEQWGVRADEAQGRLFLGLDIGLPLESLVRPIRECLSNGTPEPITLEATNRRGRSMRCVVTMQPLRLSANHLDGIILLIEESAPGEAGV